MARIKQKIKQGQTKEIADEPEAKEPRKAQVIDLADLPEEPGQGGTAARAAQLPSASAPEDAPGDRHGVGEISVQRDFHSRLSHGERCSRRAPRSFVVRNAARSLHYDFRLEPTASC
jgi:hypothetical protein